MEINTSGWSTASIPLGSPSPRRRVALFCSGQPQYRGWRGTKSMKPNSGCGKHACIYWKHWENGWEALGISRDDKKQLRQEHRDGPCAGSHWFPVARGASRMCNSTVEWAGRGWLCLPLCSLPPLALMSRIFHTRMKVGRGVPEGLCTSGTPLLEFIRAEGRAAPGFPCNSRKTGGLMWEGNLCSQMQITGAHTILLTLAEGPMGHPNTRNWL